MTRVLVLGTVPPGGGPRAFALRRLVADHLAMGDSVEVWSQSDLAVAHVHEPRAGLALVARLAAAAPRFDELILRIQPGWPFTGKEDRNVRAAVFLGLGLVARRFSQVTVLLDSPIHIPGGVGGRPTKDLWSRAHVVVENDEDRERMLAVPWVDPERLTVAPPPAEPRPAGEPTWPKPDTPDLRAAVMDVIQLRAAADRRLRRAGERLVARERPADTRVRAEPEEEPRPRDLAGAFEAAHKPRPPRRGALALLVARKMLGRLRAVLR